MLTLLFTHLFTHVIQVFSHPSHYTYECGIHTWIDNSERYAKHQSHNPLTEDKNEGTEEKDGQDHDGGDTEPPVILLAVVQEEAQGQCHQQQFPELPFLYFFAQLRDRSKTARLQMNQTNAPASTPHPSLSPSTHMHPVAHALTPATPLTLYPYSTLSLTSVVSMIA